MDEEVFSDSKFNNDRANEKGVVFSYRNWSKTERGIRKSVLK